MPILAFISSLFGPAVDLVKNLHLSDADRMTLENQLAKIQADVQTKMIELEMQKLELQKVEATRTNFLTASWRPIASLLVIGIILLASFGLATPAPQFYELAQYLLVGYVGGRSIEKASNVVGEVINKVVKK